MKICVLAVIVLVTVDAAKVPGGVVPGGKKLHDAPESDEKVKKAIEFGLRESSKKANKENFLGLEKIEKVETQIVSGVKYHLYVQAGESDCKVKDNNFDLKTCKPKNAKSCKMEVVNKASENNHQELVFTTCA